ncbi:UbiX family flavin prenyltransferase [Deinococcus yavapaiensis]|uniref:Flavin prenyltransferase UbiX n=1 Tax=Deinococcus yavapaiensis KR-236 TaxID=694435 RepID=A0A318S7S8_9DEIO|nr:UbiX family flavin prenyltransferase [Deinococcus yavapaiensis]PYE51091.1 4-hydroxy-3-polyprenylbenzoate decarboxylase [Deinococcus yavapaiensis KR-236]
MRIVVGVTGGSGIPYAVDILGALRTLGVESHLVVTAGAARVLSSEGGGKVADLEALASVTHSDRDLGASVASGSYRTDGMIVVPCSATTLAKIALGLGDNLVSRAAHVTLKERRRLVLVIREDPLPRAMLENMLRAFDAGATIMTASPGFYHAPTSVQDMLSFVTTRALDQFGLETGRMKRWGES